MKLLLIFSIVGFSAGASTGNLWMEMFSQEVAAAFEGDDRAGDKSVFEVTSELGLSVMAKMFSRVNLKDKLINEKGPFTIFGPTNKAFEELPEKVLDLLKHNRTLLEELIRYHVAPGKFESGSLKNEDLIQTLNGEHLRINVYERDFGRVITAAGRVVAVLDKDATNGVVHVLHHVMYPPPGTIADVLKSDPFLAKLGELVQRVEGLMEKLDTDGPFTLFAPGYKSFEYLSKECLKQLKTDNDLLKKVLTYHVVPFTAFSAGLYCEEKLPTLEGSTIFITKKDGQLAANKVKVVRKNFDLTNGAMHIIDRVLIPPGTKGDCAKDSLNYDVKNGGFDLFW